MGAGATCAALVAYGYGAVVAFDGGRVPVIDATVAGSAAHAIGWLVLAIMPLLAVAMLVSLGTVAALSPLVATVEEPRRWIAPSAARSRATATAAATAARAERDDATIVLV